MTLFAAALERLVSEQRDEFVCPGCQSVFVVLGERPEGACEDCEARAGLALVKPQAPEDLLERAGVPALFRQQWGRERWCSHFARKLPGAVSGWDRRKSLTLYGPPGTGKTGLATLLLGEWLERGGSGAWMSAERMLELLQLSISADRSGHPDRSRYLREAMTMTETATRTGLLVLDDLFASGRTTGYGVERMHRVIAERYNDMKPTICTTNFSPKALKATLESLGSRLLDQRLASLVLLDGPDRRSVM